MTDVLTIAKDAYAAIGADAFESLTDSANAQSRRARSLVNKSGQTLARLRNAFGQGWVVLTREYEFNTVVGQANYSLPDDYAELIDKTVWDRTTYYNARGALTPQEWQAYKSGIIDSVALTPRYRLRRSPSQAVKVLSLDPTPTEVEALVFEYISSGWLVSRDGNYLDRIASDTDEPLFDPVLMRLDIEWRARRAQGRDYSAELGEFEAERDSRFGSDSGGSVISLNGESEYGLTQGNIPESGYGP